MNSINAQARQELEIIRQSSGGFLKPSTVVAYARNKKSALHNLFEWDDTKAAASHRIAQARSIIRVAVVISEQTSEKVRAFVSLSSDRGANRGYRSFADVLDDEELMLRLIEDAKTELAAFVRKFNRLREIGELNNIFIEIDRLEAKPEKKRNEHQVSA